MERYNKRTRVEETSAARTLFAERETCVSTLYTMGSELTYYRQMQRVAKENTILSSMLEVLCRYYELYKISIALF